VLLTKLEVAMATSILQFVKDYEKLFGATAAVATIAALIFTGCQIQNASKSLEASTVYGLQKEGRDLHAVLFREHKDAYKSVLGLPATDKVNTDEVDFVATSLIQYFSSVVNQHRNGVIGDDYWPAFDREMCSLLRRPSITSFWKTRVERGSYGEDFKQWGSKCLTGA
jgi:hypothetical protein